MKIHTPPWPAPHHGIIGHRGLAHYAPENTLAGLYAAAEHGLNWVEVDVQLLRDGHFVIFHDLTLERTTQKSGCLFEQSLADLHNLGLDSIPSLAALISTALELNLSLNLEIKAEHPQQLGCAMAFYETLQTLWPKNKALPLVSSFHWEVLKNLRSLDDTLWLGYLTEEWNEAMLALAFQDYTTLNCDKTALSPAQLALFNQTHPGHAPVCIYTVNDPLLAKSYLSNGAYGIFSDAITATL